MIKYLIMDVDGTLTDGKIYMGPNGEAMKAFSVKDGYIFNYILKPAGIRPIVLTARTSNIVQLRCEELGIKDVYQGKLDKLAALKEIVTNNNLECCAYFGDDILDLSCMTPIKEAGGIVGCPSDAAAEIKAASDYICINEAGKGALREFVEWLVKPRIDENEILRRITAAKDYLYSIDVSEADIGKKIIINDKFFYFIQSYETSEEQQCKLESHRDYIDIQIIMAGSEVIEVADISRLTISEEYDKEKDTMFWNIPSRMTRITLKSGDCIIFYPENAHRGCIRVKNPERVVKIVGKVKVN